MLDEIVLIEVAEVECVFVARRGGVKRLVALQSKEELRVFAEVETSMHSLNELIHGDVLAITGKVAMVCEAVQQGTRGPAW